MTTVAQVTANRENGSKSRGPKTAVGKERSRCNAYVDGLAGAGVVLSERDRRNCDERVRALSASLQPATITWKSLYTMDMAYESHDGGPVLCCSQSQCRERKALAALLTWDKTAAPRLRAIGRQAGERSGTAPRPVAKDPARLRLADRPLAGLGELSRPRRRLDRRPARLALDMLATPAEFRHGRTALEGDDDDETRTIRLARPPPPRSSALRSARPPR